jgi:hypothetical protein
MSAINSDQSVITTFVENLADASNGHTTVTIGSVDRGMRNGTQDSCPMRNGTQEVGPLKNGAICIGLD